MLAMHRVRRTWTRDVDTYVTLTEFARRKFIEGGLPESKLVVKPNFVHPDPGSSGARGEYFLYVGRLSEEKGVRTLLRAWAGLGEGAELRIAGAGPLETEVRRAAAASGVIRYLGQLPRQAVLEQLRAARALVFPSEWFEGMPVAILEAFACGRPVIATRHGALAEIVTEDVTGMLFARGAHEELAQRVNWTVRNEELVEEMGRRARKEYERRYTSEANYPLLMNVYRQALDHRGASGAGGARVATPTGPG
jgi:glycosyltransferase involved in cell wall biosynthesis